jgi:hypothetical protein
MSIVLQSTGGGSVSIVEPTTASNFTQTLPASTGTVMVADGSGNLSVTGNLSFNSGYGSVATAYGCRAWINFNGTGTIAIRGSGNVSSITDNGTGNYAINLTTAMPDTNYTVCSSTSQDNTNNTYNTFTTQLRTDSSTSSVGILSGYNPAGPQALDCLIVSVAVFR